MNAVLQESAGFRDARQALRFALTVEGSPARPGMNRLWDRMARGDGLTGLDAAAQAGMILWIVEGLGQLAASILIASTAPHSKPCYCRRVCCSGKIINSDWRDAIDTICYEMIREEPQFSGLIDKRLEDGTVVGSMKTIRYVSILPPGTKYELRIALAMKLFRPGKLTLPAIADATGYSEDVVQRYHRRVVKWIRGERAKLNQAAIEGIESRAWADLETVFREARIICEH